MVVAAAVHRSTKCFARYEPQFYAVAVAATTTTTPAAIGILTLSLHHNCGSSSPQAHLLHWQSRRHRLSRHSSTAAAAAADKVAESVCVPLMGVGIYCRAVWSAAVATAAAVLPAPGAAAAVSGITCFAACTEAL